MSTRDANYSAGHRHTTAGDARAETGAPAVDDLSSAMALMRARGLRVSAARRLVLEALLAADGPMSAEQISEGLPAEVQPSVDTLRRWMHVNKPLLFSEARRGSFRLGNRYSISGGIHLAGVEWPDRQSSSRRALSAVSRRVSGLVSH